jgi:hypothetical protein
MTIAEAQALAVLIDTVYLSALVNCSPARRGAVLNLLTEIPPEMPRIPGDSRKASLPGAGKVLGSIGYTTAHKAPHSYFINYISIDICHVGIIVRLEISVI